jgi:hypothetical protein
MTTTLANILRTVSPTSLSRKQLKVKRAQLRRAGVTNLNGARRNSPYAVDTSTETRSDKRAQGGAIVVAVAALVSGAA